MPFLDLLHRDLLLEVTQRLWKNIRAQFQGMNPEVGIYSRALVYEKDNEYNFTADVFPFEIFFDISFLCMPKVSLSQNKSVTLLS